MFQLAGDVIEIDEVGEGSADIKRYVCSHEPNPNLFGDFSCGRRPDGARTLVNNPCPRAGVLLYSLPRDRGGVTPWIVRDVRRFAPDGSGRRGCHAGRAQRARPDRHGVSPQRLSRRGRDSRGAVEGREAHADRHPRMGNRTRPGARAGLDRARDQRSVAGGIGHPVPERLPAGKTGTVGLGKMPAATRDAASSELAGAGRQEARHPSSKSCIDAGDRAPKSRHARRASAIGEKAFDRLLPRSRMSACPNASLPCGSSFTCRSSAPTIISSCSPPRPITARCSRRAAVCLEVGDVILAEMTPTYRASSRMIYAVPP